MATSEAQPVRERQGFPPGVPCWIDSEQPDPEAAAAFYGGLFGWQFEERSAAGRRCELPGGDPEWQGGPASVRRPALLGRSGVEHLHRGGQRG